MTTVYFATNRKPLAPFNAPWFGFDPAPLTPDGLTFAEATVTGTDTADQSSGSIDAIDQISQQSFSANSRTALTNSPRDLLVFIHGFANAFEDAIKRAAFNRQWLAESGVPACDLDVLAFTWPSSGALIAAPPEYPDEAYVADRGRASQSGYHLAHFLNELSGLVGGFDPMAGRRVILLTHSMGNWVLQAGVEAFFFQIPPPALMFDEVVLAAADEVATTFETPGDSRLSDLPKIAGRISVYSSTTDIALILSQAINGNFRLGRSGADNESNTALYPPPIFRSVDCSGVRDYSWIDPPDATHQYYRRSPTVRQDIAALIAGSAVAPGISSL